MCWEFAAELPNHTCPLGYHRVDVTFFDRGRCGRYVSIEERFGNSRFNLGFAGGFNSTSVSNPWFMSTDTLAAIPTRTLDVNAGNTFVRVDPRKVLPAGYGAK